MYRDIPNNMECVMSNVFVLIDPLAGPDYIYFEGTQDECYVYLDSCSTDCWNLLSVVRKDEAADECVKCQAMFS